MGIGIKDEHRWVPGYGVDFNVEQFVQRALASDAHDNLGAVEEAQNDVNACRAFCAKLAGLLVSKGALSEQEIIDVCDAGYLFEVKAETTGDM